MADTRFAGPAIAGYTYQFDKTILELVAQSDGDAAVVVEGIEDVDLHTAERSTAVQCKYHVAGKFSLPGIRDPLLLMLRAFANGRRWSYRLYGHYGASEDEDVPGRLTVEELKAALTEQKRKPKRTTVEHFADFEDDTLAAFAESLTIEAGPSLEEQRERVESALCDALGCPVEDVRDLHYADAFVHVMQAAMNHDPDERRLTRAGFLAALDRKPDMFTRWHRAFLGQERFVKAVKRRVQSQGLLDPKLRRTLILGPREIASGTRTTSVVDLIAGLATLGFGIGKLRTARPWTVVLDAPDERVAEIKADLVARDVMIHDGFEDLVFRPTLFDRDAVVNVGGSKVTRVSYDVRIIRDSTLRAFGGDVTPPAVVLAFCDDDCKLHLHDANRELRVAGCDVEQIADILGALK